MIDVGGFDGGHCLLRSNIKQAASVEVGLGALAHFDLGMEEGREVRYNVGAEGLDGKRAGGEELDGFRESARWRRAVGPAVGVGVPDAGVGFEPLLDRCESGSEKSGMGKVGVDIGTRQPVLEMATATPTGYP